jgi:hypothetical protein
VVGVWPHPLDLKFHCCGDKEGERFPKFEESWIPPKDTDEAVPIMPRPRLP